MQPRTFWPLAIATLLFTSALRAEEGWGQLKVGMSSDEATEALGEPLIKTIGRGFELWVYDNSAEAIFFGGPLVGWTTPSNRKTAASTTVDVWQKKPGAANTATFILTRPTKRIERRRDLIPASNAGSSLYKIRN